VTLEFLTPSPAVTAESPIAQATRRDGATLGIRHGWLVAVSFGSPDREADAFRETVAWADLSPLTTFDDGVVDLTTGYAALLLAGPRAQETIARFCALDLRQAGPGDRLAGSIARTPGLVLVEAPARYLLLFGAALSEYMWTVVSDAGRSLGGRPAGWDAADAIRAAAPPAQATHA
jgi:glycine cleavage system aminomethyltransferase T